MPSRPPFLRAMLLYHAHFFIPVENKFAMLRQDRIYSNPQRKQSELLGLSACVEYFLKAILEQDKHQFEKFLNMLRDYQLVYFEYLCKMFHCDKQGLTNTKNDILKQSLVQSIKPFHHLLSKLDETTPILVSNIRNYTCTNSSHTYKENVLSNDVFKMVSLFNQNYNQYKTLINDFEKLKISEKVTPILHSDNVVINEFMQFLTHLSYSLVAEELLQEKGVKRENIENYIFDNTRKANNHLERAILDINKVILFILIKNQLIHEQEIKKILKARQDEIDSISMNIHDRSEKYSMLVSQFLKNMHSDIS